MDNNFKKMKRKLLVEFYLKISLISLSLWLTVSGLIILFTNLFGAKFPFYYSILIGAVIGIGLFVVLLFKKKPNDTQIALRIDKDFDMHEKVATMVTFQNTDGFMYEKQREDAKENLNKKEVRKLPFRLAVVNIPALVFGVSLFTASFFTPSVVQKKDENKDKKDEINDKTDKIINDIHEIINNSEAYETLKAELNQILEDLLAELKDDDDPQSRLHKVTVAERKVDAALDRANTKEEVGAALVANTEKDSALYKLGVAIQEGNQTGVTLALRKLEKDFGSRSTYSGQALSDYLVAIVNTINTSMKASLEAEVQVSEKDGLYTALKNLSAKLDAIQKRYAEYLKAPTENKGVPEEQTKSDTTDALEIAIIEINQCLQAQAVNTELAEKVKAYMETLIDPLGSGNGGQDGSNRDDKKDDDGEKNDGENGGENNGNNKKDDGDGDKSDGDGDGDKGDDQDKGDNGDGDSEGDGDKKGDEDGSGDGKGEDGDSEGSGSGQGESNNGGNNKGDGASGGSGSTSYGSNDKVYTDKNGYSEYGDVLDDSHNDASKDNEKNGDDELGDILDDYFNSLYGNDNGGNTTPRP